MALASGQWVDKEIKGHPPSPRYGHALAVAGNIAFLFGGVSTLNSPDGQPKYHNDFYILTVSPSDVSWEVMPQNGQIPPAREGHSLCLIKSKLYLFGGSSFSQAEECLPGVYSFDIGTLTWEKLKTSGRAVQSLKHSSDVVGENIYVFGGILKGNACDDLLVFNTVALTWTPVKTTGSVPSARFNHTTALLGEQIYMFGGSSAEDSYYKDIYILDTGTLAWQKCEVKGDSPSGSVSQTFTAHYDKDIYLFGGRCESKNGTTTNEIQNKDEMESAALCRDPSSRHGHAAFILHSHIYIIGGANEEQEFNDVKVMKLINPSERQPIMKEILSEFGIQGVSNGFAPTKVPKVKYELTVSPFPARIDSPPPIQVAHHRDFNTVRNEAMEMVTRAFAIVDNAFQKLDNEKSELFQATIAFQYEKEAYNTQSQKQQQELKEMLEKHKAQNEAWLKARAEENDRERKELCKLREEVLHEQEKLKEEQSNIQKRSEQLLSIMQQFKGM